MIWLAAGTVASASFFATAYAALTHGERDQRARRHFAIALGLMAGGQVIGDRWAAEALPIVAYCFLIAGCLDLIDDYTHIGRLGSALDAAVFAAGVGLLVWEPLLTDRHRSAVATLLAGGEPSGAIALVGLAALLVDGSTGGRQAWLLLGSTVGFFVSDIGALGYGGASRGTWPALISALASCGIALSVRDWTDGAFRASSASLHRGRRPLILSMVFVGALVAIPIDFVESAGEVLKTDELLVRVGLRVVLLAAVGARLLLQARDNEHLLDELSQSTLQLATVVEHTADAVVFTDATGRVLQWNRRAEDLFGISRERIIGTHALEHFADKSAAAAVLEAVRGSTEMRVVTVPVRLRGQLRPLRFQIVPVRDDGRLVGIVAVAHDDTSRIVADHTRQTFADLDPGRALARFAEALSMFVPFDVLSLSAVDGDTYREMARLNRTGDFVDGPMFEATPDEELATGSMSALGVVDDGTTYVMIGAETQDPRRRAIGAASINSFIGVRLRDPGTAAVTGYLTLGYHDPAGATQSHADAIAAVGPDIAQSVENMLRYERQRVAADELREWGGLRDTFLAMVAHDLHGPLTSIGSAASVLSAHRSRLDRALIDDMLSGITTTAQQLNAPH